MENNVFYPMPEQENQLSEKLVQQALPDLSRVSPEQYAAIMNAMANFIREYTYGCKTMLEMGYNLGTEMRKKNTIESVSVSEINQNEEA